jgi:hypothetical protein
MSSGINAAVAKNPRQGKDEDFYSAVGIENNK